MASGVKVAPECQTTFNQDLKMKNKLKYILYKLNDANDEIVIADTKEPVKQPTDLDDLNKEEKERKLEEFELEEFQKCIKLVEKNQCRYLVFDLVMTKDGIERKKLFFFSVIGEECPTKKKMIHASSKDALKKKLDGIYGKEILVDGVADVESRDAYYSALEILKKLK